MKKNFEPYHTNSSEYPLENREVYHDYDNCPEGNRIQPQHRIKGSGSKPRCDTCFKMDGWGVKDVWRVKSEKIDPAA